MIFFQNMSEFGHMVLGDFHIHTNFSDGFHSVREIVDLYGRAGFGAIAITDHLCERHSFLGKAARWLNKSLCEETFPTYINKIYEEAERAWKLYRMRVIPGVEFTKNSLSQNNSAHILGLGIHHYIDPDQHVVQLLNQIRDAGGVSVAAHPVPTRRLEAQTYYLWDRRAELQSLIDVWEVASGPHLFPEVSAKRMPAIANSDLHHRRQIRSWKTVVQSRLNVEDILHGIRKQNTNYIFYKGAHQC